MKKTAQQLYDEAFCHPRDPRSAEYKAGVLAALMFRLGETPYCPQCPHPVGSAQSDAWFSGSQEGHGCGKEYLGTWLQCQENN